MKETWHWQGKYTFIVKLGLKYKKITVKMAAIIDNDFASDLHLKYINMGSNLANIKCMALSL